MRWFVLVVAAGCYRPATERACEVHCGLNPGTNAMDLCPSGLACGGDGLCTEPGSSCTSDAGSTDVAAGDAAADAGSRAACYGDLYRICFPAPLTEVVNINLAQTIDTGSSPVCMKTHTVANQPVCVIAGSRVTISAPLRFVGPNPVMIVADQTIDISSTLDLSDHMGDINRAAGSPYGGCGGIQPLVGNSGSDEGGGAGGSFGRLGGYGGSSANGATGGTPGPASPVPPPVQLRGGCDGQPGAGSAAFGRGGGALHMVANGAIAIEATAIINASGGGSPEVSGGFGAGGGGSGGFIGCESAVQCTLSGIVFANGGGGASGDLASAMPGLSSIAWNMPGAGGGGAVYGGSGAYENSTAPDGASTGSGPAGGGGGGVGVILFRAAVIDGGHSSPTIIPF